jgi:hypothetical protein
LKGVKLQYFFQNNQNSYFIQGNLYTGGTRKVPQVQFSTSCSLSCFRSIKNELNQLLFFSSLKSAHAVDRFPLTSDFHCFVFSRLEILLPNAGLQLAEIRAYALNLCIFQNVQLARKYARIHVHICASGKPAKIFFRVLGESSGSQPQELSLNFQV